MYTSEYVTEMRRTRAAVPLHGTMTWKKLKHVADLIQFHFIPGGLPSTAHQSPPSSSPTRRLVDLA